jgi:hypothetical protein
MSDNESTSSTEPQPIKALTVEKLMSLLQEILAEDPEAKSLAVYHTEFGGLVRSRIVEVCDEINGKKTKRFLIIE